MVKVFINKGSKLYKQILSPLNYFYMFLVVLIAFAYKVILASMLQFSSTPQSAIMQIGECNIIGCLITTIQVKIKEQT